MIPSYSAAAFVREAVDSALAQTYKNFEVIVVDDGSTDNTKELLTPYIKAGKIRYMYQRNGGLSAARNTGIKNAKGEYIALLDADDIFLPRKLEEQVAYLEAHPDCDISYCDLYHFWDEEPDALLKLAYTYYSGDEVLPNLVKVNSIAPGTMVLRKSVFDRWGLFNESFRRSEDLEFLVRILSKGARIMFLDKILLKARSRRQGNLQSFESQPEMKVTTLGIFENLYNSSSDAERKRLGLPKYLSGYRLKAAFAYLENKDKANAKKYFKAACAAHSWKRFLSNIAWVAIAMIPAGLLAAILRTYHLGHQQGLYKRV